MSRFATPLRESGGTGSPEPSSVPCFRASSPIIKADLTSEKQTPSPKCSFTYCTQKKAGGVSLLPLVRRGRDSNPGYSRPYAAFRVRSIRPLWHLSLFPEVYRRSRHSSRYFPASRRAMGRSWSRQLPHSASLLPGTGPRYSAMKRNVRRRSSVTSCTSRSPRRSR